ncbi:MAG: hypothetical protein Kow0081_1220 [Candidatus Dojkabacteria bacterium]
MTKNGLFERIYDELANSLFRFCIFRLKNKEVSQGIVAEAFVRLYEQDTEKVESQKAWLY